MIDLKVLRTELTTWEKGLARRGYKGNLEKVWQLYSEVVSLEQELEVDLAARNKAAKEKDIEAGKKLSAVIEKKEKTLRPKKEELEQLTREIPNLPLGDVPDGGEADAKVIAEAGKPANITNPKDHIELGEGLGIIDIERGAKVSGARFYYLKNQAVELEWALVNWIKDLLKKKGFEFLWTPVLLGEKAMLAAGYLGKAADEIYKTQDDLYLIGTSEASILAYHMDEIIDLPKRYAAFTPCFRREAGSYGKDVKGIIRTHQFDKIEMFAYVEAGQSESEHEFLVGIEEEIMKGLGLPYRKVMLAAGDLGVAAAKTYDLEVWLPSQNTYRELTSTSNCTDWQSRAANIRYRDGEGKSQYPHTLNGTAVAVGRTLVAILENYQQPDGSVKLPEVLHKYLDFKEIRPK